MKVILIDDHPLVLSALQTAVGELDRQAEVVSASHAQAAREALARHPDCDLLLLDLKLPDGNGHALLAEFRRSHPAVPVVVVSASENRDDVLLALDAGAMGYVCKRSTQAEIVDALRAVLAGEVVMPARLASTPRAGGGLEEKGAALDNSLPALDRLGLTPRQRDVLQLLLKGMPNKVIARELKLSVETVKDHVASLLRALGVVSRTQAVLKVSRLLPGTE